MAMLQIKCNDPVKVTCYGETKIWERQDALGFFLAGARFFEGAEHERYFNIYCQLLDGAKEASDI
jgi:hypothetical protein